MLGGEWMEEGEGERMVSSDGLFMMRRGWFPPMFVYQRLARSGRINVPRSVCGSSLSLSLQLRV